jgi:hypothetical protein
VGWNADTYKVLEGIKSLFCEQACRFTATSCYEDKENRALIRHYQMGHVSFDKMYQVFPNVMSGVDRTKLKCDACDAKHTRIS